jgi:DNA-binding response OmpR family regulator
MPEAICIAVIDDTPSVLRITALMLEDAGFQAKTYSNALLFINSLQYERPSLALLDLMMPGMNGIECLERLSAMGLAFPVLIHTSIDDAQYREKALALGAKAYVLKDELLSRTEELIGQYVCSSA